jgi:hypothetical protein
MANENNRFALRADREEIQRQLGERLGEGKSLLDKYGARAYEFKSLANASTREFERWHQYNIDLIRRLFADESMATEYDAPLPMLVEDRGFPHSAIPPDESNG